MGTSSSSCINASFFSIAMFDYRIFVEHFEAWRMEYVGRWDH
jgi:hypothetical protein